MSLINDMLKDLERRHADEEAPQGVVLDGVGWHDRQQGLSGRAWAQLVLLTLFAVFAGTALYYAWQPAQTGRVQQALKRPALLPSQAVDNESGYPPGGQLRRSIPQLSVYEWEGDVAIAAATSSAGQARDRIAVNQHPSGQSATTSAADDEHVDAKDESGKPSPPATAQQSAAQRQTAERQGSRELVSEGGDSDAAPAASAASDSDAEQLKKKPRALPPRRLAQRAYKRALVLLDQGQTDAARGKLNQALSEYRQHTAARAVLVGLLTRQGYLSRAEALVREGLELKPDHLAFIKLQARIMIARGENERARDLLEKKRPAISRDASYYALLAAVYQRLGHHNDAAGLYQSLVGAQPGRGVWWLGLGISLEASGKEAQARQAYQRAGASGTLTPKLLQFTQKKVAALS